MKKWFSKNVHEDVAVLVILAVFLFGASRVFTPSQTLSGVLLLMLAAVLGFAYFQPERKWTWPTTLVIFTSVSTAVWALLSLPQEKRIEVGLQNVAWDGLATLAAGVCLEQLLRARKAWALLGWVLGAAGVAYWAMNLGDWPWSARWIWLGTVGAGTGLAYFLAGHRAEPLSRGRSAWWQSGRLQAALISSFWIAFAAAIWVRNAWVSDDAYITFRTVDNFLHGYGLRWNVVERVQAYTHPLWMLVMTGGAALTHEVYYTSISLGIGLTLVALLWFWFKGNVPRENWIIPVIGLTFSEALVNFVTSGLENALAYALTAGFYVLALKDEKSTWRFWLLSVFLSLGMLTRMDLALLFGIPWLWFFWEQGKARGFVSAVGWGALGFSPFVLWEIFSVIYYGFAVPNTAFAKLGAGMSWDASVQQGLVYLLNSLTFDPVVLWVIGLGMVLGFLEPNWRKKTLACGILAYLLYVLKIGGDFMSGRFLTVPFVGALILLTWSVRLKNFRIWSVAVCVLALSLISPWHPWLNQRQFNNYNADKGIVDERAFYFPLTGLLHARPDLQFNNDSGHPFLPYLQTAQEFRAQGAGVLIHFSVGLVGYYAGPKVYVLDVLALANPLLAHLPSLSGQRIGHFKRKLPGGYLESLRTGQNKIFDPAVALMYAHLVKITQAPLWDGARWREIMAEAFQRAPYPIPVNVRHYQNDLHWEDQLSDAEDLRHQNYVDLIHSGVDAFTHVQYAKAERLWQAAKQLDPKPGIAQGDLGILYVGQGDFTLAAENFRAAEKSSPQVWGNQASLFAKEWQDEMTP